MRSTLIRHFDHDFVGLFVRRLFTPYFLYVHPVFATDFLAVHLTLVVLFDVLATGEWPSIPDLGVRTIAHRYPKNEGTSSIVANNRPYVVPVWKPLSVYAAIKKCQCLARPPPGLCAMVNKMTTLKLPNRSQRTDSSTTVKTISVLSFFSMLEGL